MNKKQDEKQKQEAIFFMDIFGMVGFCLKKQANVPEWTKEFVYEINKNFYPEINYFFVDNDDLKEVKTRVDHDKGQYFLETSLNFRQFQNFALMHYEHRFLEARRYIEKIAGKDFESVAGRKDPYYDSIYYKIGISIDKLVHFFKGRTDLSEEQMSFLLENCPSMWRAMNGGNDDDITEVFREFRKTTSFELPKAAFFIEGKGSPPDPENFKQNEYGEVIYN